MPKKILINVEQNPYWSIITSMLCSKCWVFTEHLEHPENTPMITFSACQFKQVWCWDVDQMLYFTLEKHKKCLKASGAQPQTPLGSSQRSPDLLAGFKPILCLVVFFIGPNCMYANIVIPSLLNEDLHPSDKKCSTAWDPDKA